ncbi:hypothetical protein ACWFR5_12345 [Streptomyces sp. NPDC055092]
MRDGRSAALAEAKVVVRHIVGLQRRQGPAARYTRDLVGSSRSSDKTQAHDDLQLTDRGDGHRAVVLLRRHARAEGVGDFAEWLAADDGDGISRLGTMIGALVLDLAAQALPLSVDPRLRARGSLVLDLAARALPLSEVPRLRARGPGGRRMTGSGAADLRFVASAAVGADAS